MSPKIKPWKEISREVMFEKFGRGIEKVIFEQSDGELVDLYIKKEKPVAAVLAITEDNKIILVKQFRPGPKKFLYELPGGIAMNDSIEMEDFIAEELLEETGYKGNVKFVTNLVDCGYSTRIKNCLVATDCQRIQGIDNTLRDNDGKNIGFKEEKEVVLVTLKEFRKLLRSGQCSDIEIGYLALDYWGLL
jgi:ADP-ribose pyrophosphatase